MRCHPTVWSYLLSTQPTQLDTTPPLYPFSPSFGATEYLKPERISICFSVLGEITSAPLNQLASAHLKLGASLNQFTMADISHNIFKYYSDILSTFKDNSLNE